MLFQLLLNDNFNFIYNQQIIYYINLMFSFISLRSKIIILTSRNKSFFSDIT